MPEELGIVCGREMLLKFSAETSVAFGHRRCHIMSCIKYVCYDLLLIRPRGSGLGSPMLERISQSNLQVSTIGRMKEESTTSDGGRIASSYLGSAQYITNRQLFFR